MMLYWDLLQRGVRPPEIRRRATFKVDSGRLGTLRQRAQAPTRWAVQNSEVK